MEKLNIAIFNKIKHQNPLIYKYDKPEDVIITYEKLGGWD